MTEKDILKGSKLMILISHLDKKEFKDLGYWLRSPIHNSSKNVIKLYDILHHKYRKSSKLPNTFQVMQHIGILPKAKKYKDITYKHKQDLRQTMSLLTIQIQDFLIWKKTQENPIERNRRLMDALLEKQLFDLIRPIMNKSRKMQKALALRDVAYCEDDYKLTEMDFYMAIFLKNRNAAAAMKDTVNALEQSCLSQLLRYYCAVSNAKHIVKTEDFPLMDLLRNYVENSKSKQVFTVQIYYRLLKMLEDEQPQDYHALKVQLFDNLGSFSTNELRQFLNFMSNHCMRMIRQGNEIFTSEQFDIFVVGLQHNCWTTGVYFSSPLFAEIVQTALSLNKLTWTDDFLTDYGDKLPPESKDNTLNYCLALAAFQKKDYDLAQEHLMGVHTAEDFIYHLKFKILLIKIYYDKNELTFANAEEHPINNELKALIQYVLPSTNKKMSETIRQQYSNFANFFKRILHRKNRGLLGYKLTSGDIKMLQTDLAGLKPLIERGWLVEKIGELVEK